METMKCLSDTVNTGWVKSQEFMSNVDQIISTEMSECCSVQLHVMYHVCTPAVAGHCMCEVDVEDAP